MSLLGIDVGTTGCKVALFSEQGKMLASAYKEYNMKVRQPGWAELDAHEVWAIVQHAIRTVTPGVTTNNPVHSVAVSSLGEAVVPVTADRQILGPSILNFDVRGEVYLGDLAARIPNEQLYQINGNTLGNHYSLTKLKWIKEHERPLYDSAYKLLHWSAFIAFMLGAEPALDYSLASRTLLFDVQREDWSDELLAIAGIDRDKLPKTVPSGTVVGTVLPGIAAELGLSPDTVIVTGAHDQCANAVGCGVIEAGSAVYGMGTFICITPVFTTRRAPHIMIERGLSTEHHAVPGQYVCFIYNQGGSMVKWYRDTFATLEHQQAAATGRSIYGSLFAEVPAHPSSIMVLPHFMLTGPPDFIGDSVGVMAGLKLETSRGDILKGIVESTTFALREIVESLPPTGIAITDYRAVGGGSQSDQWVQVCADIMGKTFMRPTVTEAGTLGAAIISGIGSGRFASYKEGVEAMVRLDRVFEPNTAQHERYASRYEKYRQLWPLMADYLRELATDVPG
jgi:xylulokinase